jgi:hypothetical protein
MKKAARRVSVATTNQENEVSSVGHFGSALFDIGWRLAVTVIIFLWGGNALDEKLSTKPLFTVIGFLLIIVSFVLIVRQVLQQIPRSLGGLKDD